VPVPLVMRFAVEEVVVVTAACVPVGTPRRVVPLARAPVVVGKRSGRLGLGHARSADAGKSQTRGDSSRGCDSFQCHAAFVPLRFSGETSDFGMSAADLLSSSLISAELPGGDISAPLLRCATVIGCRRPGSS
jgi:hypothetical protein